jgi:tryptophan-rich sensory protein
MRPLLLIGLLALCYAVAAVGGLATADSVTSWYPTLVRPDWRPPNWLFGPVWTTLYTAMAVAMWNIARQVPWPDSRPAVVAFGIQLALNAAWSPLFFGAKALGLALVDIVAMWFAIAATIAVFWRHSRLSAALLVPYLAWVSFATALNAWIWWMN